ncbi:hypothetical protein AX15_002939 [Amanita polypyramis BW_CC]|nr:hypothetical protein AX15_002939 [Amanita polypyramis BW_CC]
MSLPDPIPQNASSPIPSMPLDTITSSWSDIQPTMSTSAPIPFVSATSVASYITATSSAPMLTSSYITFTSIAASSSTMTSSTSSIPVVADLGSNRAADLDRTGAIVGGVLGAIAGFLIAILAILIVLRYRRRKRTAPSAEFLSRAPRSSLPFQPLPSGNDDVLPIYDQGTYRNNPFYEKQRATLS